MARICTAFQKNTANSGSASVLDQAIHDYIFDRKAEAYQELLQEEERFPVHLALSEWRRGLYSWYQFREGARILEIGGGYGAVTGVLCEKAQEVFVTERSDYRAEIIAKRYEDKDNLCVYAGDILDMNFEQPFDYIVLTGILERIGRGTFTMQVYADYLKELASQFLKEDGVILAAVDNRYGLRYFSGMKDVHTGKVFDSIRRYPQGNHGAHSFTRQEVDELCRLTGCSAKKVYYPLPDYRMPQLIYTDEYLPEKNLKERLIPYYPDHSSMIMNENIMYDDLVDNHVFPFFANSFLMEITFGEENVLNPAIYAAISTDRGHERGFATVIRNDESVIKIPLYTEGKQYARSLCDTVSDIGNHGLHIVTQSWDGEAIRMPYVKAPMLSNVIKEWMPVDPDKVKCIVEQLYQNILQASEQIPDSENKLMTSETKELPWGPILKRAYMELIPLNSFYENGNIIYFDQEFCREAYPAKYVLFRAIHYIYVFTMRAEKYIPLQYFKDKYEMNELWDIFQKEENRFLHDVRCHDAQKMFYQWAHVDGNRMQKNVDRLNSPTGPVTLYQIKQEENPEKKAKLQDGTKPYKTGYVPGVFDLFHVGHLNLIRRSKERCEYLIVGVLTDELVEHFKGKRPYISYEERAAIVAAITEVDEVVPVDFHNTVKMDAWNLFHFDCHFSGNDHGPDWDHDLAQLRAVGSNMEFFPYTQGVSSTQIKEKMK